MVHFALKAKKEIIVLRHKLSINTCKRSERMHTNAYADSRARSQEQTDGRWEGKIIWTEIKSQQENVAVNDGGLGKRGE